MFICCLRYLRMESLSPVVFRESFPLQHKGPVQQSSVNPPAVKVEPLRHRMVVTRCAPRRSSEDASFSTTHKSRTKPLYCAREPRYARRRPFLLLFRSFFRLLVTLLLPCCCLLLLLFVLLSSSPPPVPIPTPVSACNSFSFYFIFLYSVILCWFFFFL